MKSYFDFYVLIILMSFLSCTHVKTKVTENTELDKMNTLELFTENDKNSYVGFVYTYENQTTDEFYVELYSKTNDSYFEAISKKVDSVIYSNDVIKRSRLPLSIASKLFDFRGMKELTLFDRNHNELTTARFIRVELFDDAIMSYFTAVYKAEDARELSKAVYCIGNLRDKLSKINFSLVEDSLLTSNILNKLNLPNKNNIECAHYTNKATTSTVSVVNLDSTSCIYEKNNSDLKCIYTSAELEHIHDLIFVPITRNSKPILLTKSWVPDSDIVWSTLLVFDGTTYRLADKQRIRN